MGHYVMKLIRSPCFSICENLS